MDLLTKAAEAMDAGAQNALAYMYRMGVALDVDHHKYDHQSIPISFNDRHFPSTTCTFLGA